MQEGIICKGKYIEYDGFYWKEHNYSTNKYSKIPKKYYIQEFFCTEPNEFHERFLHRYVWSKTNGPIPKTNNLGQKMVIHHIDENELNNTLENLQLMTRGEHATITRENLKIAYPEAFKQPCCTEERKLKISQAMKGKIHTSEAVANQQASKKKNKIERIKKHLELEKTLRTFEE